MLQGMPQLSKLNSDWGEWAFSGHYEKAVFEAEALTSNRMCRGSA
jgi:hypothetical protein